MIKDGICSKCGNETFTITVNEGKSIRLECEECKKGVAYAWQGGENVFNYLKLKQDVPAEPILD